MTNFSVLNSHAFAHCLLLTQYIISSSPGMAGMHVGAKQIIGKHFYMKILALAYKAKLKAMKAKAGL